MRTTLPRWAFLALLGGQPACAGAEAPRAAMAASAYPQAPTAAMPASEPMPPPMDASDSYRADSGAAESMVGQAAAPAYAKAAPPPAPPAAPGSPAAGGATGPTHAQPQGEVSALRAPMLIYTAQLSMAVFEVSASLSKVEELARELGGYLSRRDDLSVVVRIPVARFEEALRRIESFGDVVQRNVVAEDVTEQFLDLEIRLRNARAVRDRLEKLLEKATKVEESIQLERELARVAGELEQLQGRMKYLRDRAAFSTLTISFQPRPTEVVGPSAPKLPVPWLNELGLSRLLKL